MTREELVEGLNKIDGIDKIKCYKHNLITGIEIFAEKIFITYDSSSGLRIEPSYWGHDGVYIENRTPEQVLSVVKALVE